MPTHVVDTRWAHSLQTELEKAGLKADLTSDGYSRVLIRRMQEDLAPELAKIGI